jgi:hypothetical protein
MLVSALPHAFGSAFDIDGFCAEEATIRKGRFRLADIATQPEMMRPSRSTDFAADEPEVAWLASSIG